MKINFGNYILIFRELADKVSVNISTKNNQSVKEVDFKPVVSDNATFISYSIEGDDTNNMIDFEEKITISDYKFKIKLNADNVLKIGFEFDETTPAKSVFLGSKDIDGKSITVAYFKEPN